MCRAGRQREKSYLSENRQASAGSGGAENLTHGRDPRGSPAPPTSASLSQFVDEKTETTGKGLGAEVKVGLVDRLPDAGVQSSCQPDHGRSYSEA